MKCFAIANQKGGVGKTTTAVNLSAALAQQGKRVLLVDLDPQGNATMGCGINKATLTYSVYHLLLGLAPRQEVVRRAQGDFDLWPANRDLAGAELEMVGIESRERRLKDQLTFVADDYDFILMDCPPSLSLLTLNGLCAAQGVIVPMQCEYYALEGLTDLVNTIRRVHGSLNQELKLIGLLRVMFDPRSALSQQVSQQLETRFKDKVFSAIVPRNVRMAEAPSHGLPGVLYDPEARGSIAYRNFATEMIGRAQLL